jgi:hypothetical protein
VIPLLRAVLFVVAGATGVAACGGSAGARVPESPAKRAPVRSPGTAASVGPSASPGNEQKPALAEGTAPLGTRWGTADPVSFVAAAPDRRWVTVCQARKDTNGDGTVRVDVAPDGALHGDDLTGFFMDAPGPGAAVEAFLGSDPSGRFVAFVREGRAVLRDTTTRVDTDLPADTRDDLGPFVPPRAVRFDPTGRRLLYLRRPDLGGKVVVHELATGAEAVIDPGGGELWRAEFDPSGDEVVTRVVVADTNGNGAIDWPVRPAKKTWMRCAGPLPRYAVWERPGDEAIVRVAKATGGIARDAPGLVVPMGDALVVREADGALVRIEANGRKVPIARKGCDAHLLHADAARGLLLLTCLDPKGKAEAVLVGHGPAKPLALGLSVAPGDHVFDGAPRLVPLHPGNEAALVDLDRSEVEMLTTGDRVLATSSARALVLRGRSLVVHELGGSDKTLGEVLPLAHIVRSGPVFYVPPFVVDVARGELIGRSEEPALAVSSDGALLVSEETADAAHFAVGPLSWKAPGGQAVSLR